MKFLIPFLYFILFGCTDREAVVKIPNNVSVAQQGIQNLVDSFKMEYSLSKSSVLQDSTFNRYKIKVFEFLSTNNIDGIQVHVDTVIESDLTITTKFHCNDDIAFQYGMTFKKEMDSSWDSIYNFMRGLRIGSDTIINFSYMGSHLLTIPNDVKLSLLTIYAFPTPISNRQ